MNILILGSGGREHAMAWKLSQSQKLSKLFIAPGNAGTSELGENIPIGVNDFDAIKKIVLQKKVDLVLVGPEDPLVNGIHDFFLGDTELKDIAVVGPQKMAATLEGSKEFAKEFMMRHNIPTAQYQSFTEESVEEGFKFLEGLTPPYVLKADGLAAGKGVVILKDLEEAKTELNSMLVNKKFGKASTTVVIEEFLDGIELSVFVLTDGNHYKILPTAKDYKRIGEGDTGLNTGGMGAISPVPFADKVFMDKIHDQVVKPTVDGLKMDNLPYKGFIFIGLIKVGDEPKVIEYNVRMGDPETEVVFPRIKNDFVELMSAVANGSLNELDLQIDERSATTVMTVSGGYPGTYEKGKEITGINEIEDSLVFHAGTILDNEKVVTNGGRVLAITSYGKDFKEALKTSYKNVEKLKFEGINYRKDIGFDL
ncbi:phosphoribosylamine--glycine ligase [Maribacter sp. PR1]|uniref:Phosphoribosylamine--glycine ligase n=1 Tax=Maribacter cobaltidurans TaxID=1178778 RepID=A0ABU7IQT5_9FLAO|nr:MULTISPECIES: phosphoribosylamine--glycine ligase [Maribacter]MDC6387787.1 phosphoribosylamine--glycine ligase [Maribacter sp. PR1]MEE1975176.1 phosphoribosylamine--glycine ligase [Maribacter cobaltidurans]